MKLLSEPHVELLKISADISAGGELNGIDGPPRSYQLLLNLFSNTNMLRNQAVCLPCLRPVIVNARVKARGYSTSLWHLGVVCEYRDYPLTSHSFLPLGFKNEAFRTCACQPAARSLLARGFFPCAPIRPTMAFNLDILELITLQSHNGAPNTTAWSNSLEVFWKRRQFLMPSEVLIPFSYRASFLP